MAKRRPSLPSTERVHSSASDLHLLSAPEVVRRLHQEDRRAFEATTRALPNIGRAATLIRAAFLEGGRLIYVGAGTSGRLGALDAAECPPTFGVPSSWVQALVAGGRRALSHAVEGAEDDAASGSRAIVSARVGSKDVVVGITASGRTPFVLAALKAARLRKAKIILVSCQKPSPFRGNLHIYLDTGPELVSGSTRLKAGTATKLVLNALSTAALVSLGKIYKGHMVDLQATNAKLMARAVRMVAELSGLPHAQARTLLLRAKGHPRLALVMHWTGLSLPQARAQLSSFSLAALEEAAERRRR